MEKGSLILAVFLALTVFLLGCTQPKPPEVNPLSCKSDADCATNSLTGSPTCEGAFECVSSKCVFACTDPCSDKAQPIGACDLNTAGIQYNAQTNKCTTISFEKTCTTYSPFRSLEDCTGLCVKTPGKDQNAAESGDFLYIAFHVDGKEDLAKLVEKIGGTGNPNGKHRLAVKTHLNPLGNVLSKSEYPFEVDEETVRAILKSRKDLGLPVTIGIFAGKFFESNTTHYLEQKPENLMWDENDKPILIDKVGGTYFTISPGKEGIGQNEFLDIYEKNVKSVSGIVSEWMKENPDKVIAVSFAGEVKYPPAKEGVGRQATLRWADYNPLAISRFQEYAQQKYSGNFEEFLTATGVPNGVFTGFEGIDPPRGKNRGTWDTLGDQQNPYFLLWNGFRVEEVKNHIKETVNWGKEAGIAENDFTKIYSGQAIWDTGSGQKYYWRASPLSTLEIEGINPVVSMYGDNTANEEFIKKVGEIAKNYPGKWGTLQYNPDGPCDENGYCDPGGYSVDEYYRRLKLLEENGVRIIGVEGSDDTDAEDSAQAKHFIRENFYKAVKMFLEEK